MSRADIEARLHRTPSGGGGGDSDGSLCFSDADDQSWHSPYNSNSADEIGDGAEALEERGSCISNCSFDGDSDLGLECNSPEIKAVSDKGEKDCRICHLGLESNAAESGIGIVLGCSCKDDLAAAHRQCAETWFKIKGNKTCEICGSTAKNVVSAGESELTEHSNETSSDVVTASRQPTETRSFWQGHRFLNFLLACMIFAFVISWIFHFNIPG